MRPATDLAAFLGGIAAGEGCFTGTRGQPPSFMFSVGMSATDEGVCTLLRDSLGVGYLTRWPRRQAHYDDEVAFHVHKLRDLVEVVVPFMDEHLPVSYQRRQYLEWRARLLDYWEHDAKRVRPCTREGCDEPRRAKELCRGHYYAEYGR